MVGLCYARAFKFWCLFYLNVMRKIAKCEDRINAHSVLSFRGISNGVLAVYHEKFSNFVKKYEAVKG